MENKWLTPCDYNDDEAILEANRCLSCKVPMCEKGCPTNMKIRDFIFQIKQNNLDNASKIIAGCSSLSNICSIVCPHENQCVGHCILNKKNKPIQVGKLERYIQTKTHYLESAAPKIGKRVAIIGSGPAGLSAAKELLIGGVDVDVYEQEAVAGGVMTYGIPSYRLSYNDVLRVVDDLKKLGCKFHYNTKLLESDIVAMKKDYDAIFIGIGLTKVRKLGIKNENLDGVYDALDFLKQINYNIKLNKGSLPIIGDVVVVVGAGNVAMDAARSAVRLGAKKVIIAYRRSLEEAPATKHEIAEAQQEGVEFKFLNNPVEVIGDSHVTAIKCEVMRLGEPDESGRRRPVGTNEFITIECDNIISAIGQIPENIFNEGVIATDHNYICADGLKTTVDGIYTGGDILLGAKTVVEAMRCGREFAKEILNDLK